MNICVVVVTYNRLEKLKKALKSYDNQTYLPDSIVVVNNNSVDGTFEYLDNWVKNKNNINKIVINNEQNLGATQGFSMGIKKALELDCDYVYISDDDAYADLNVFENFNVFISSKDKEELEKISIISTKVLGKDGIATAQRKKVKKIGPYVKYQEIGVCEYDKDVIDVDIFTFVGILINTKYIKRLGLPISEYFIHYDDNEYSLRFSRISKTICLTNCSVVHDNWSLDSASINRTWIKYYNIRNGLDCIKRHFGIIPYIYRIIVLYLERCSILAILLKHRSIDYIKMGRCAILDSIKGNFGQHDVYKPGCQIK